MTDDTIKRYVVSGPGDGPTEIRTLKGPVVCPPGETVKVLLDDGLANSVRKWLGDDAIRVDRGAPPTDKAKEEVKGDGGGRANPESKV